MSLLASAQLMASPDFLSRQRGVFMRRLWSANHYAENQGIGNETLRRHEQGFAKCLNQSLPALFQHGGGGGLSFNSGKMYS